jgi:hypothetical protein
LAKRKLPQGWVEGSVEDLLGLSGDELDRAYAAMAADEGREAEAALEPEALRPPLSPATKQKRKSPRPRPR